jgi:hypothetical protein
VPNASVDRVIHLTPQFKLGKEADGVRLPQALLQALEVNLRWVLLP